MEQALIGLAGIVVGVLLGGTGKYFSQRRDAWRKARANGLLLLADVYALTTADQGAPAVDRTKLGVKSWRSHRKALARFRVGKYPSGFKAGEWLMLADHFAWLERHYATRPQPQADAEQWWREALVKLFMVQELLEHAGFSADPPVLQAVVRNSIKLKGGAQLDLSPEEEIAVIQQALETSQDKPPDAQAAVVQHALQRAGDVKRR